MFLIITPYCSRPIAMRLGFEMYSAVGKIQKGSTKIQRIIEKTNVRRRIVGWIMDALQVILTQKIHVLCFKVSNRKVCHKFMYLMVPKLVNLYH